ncbi:MAG: septum formation protein Maf [Bacteroidia bacterium]|nr:septum formation protein Maf [Bacteroidia bacterium]
MKTIAPLILASGSPRRQQLLREVGLNFEVVVRPVEEVIPPGKTPVEVAEHLAWHKSEAYLDLIGDHVVLTSDTIVSLKGQLLEKPQDRADAVRMLKLLSGNVNQVISGVCIRYQEECVLFHASTLVTFRELTEWEINHYVDHFKPYDKAGAYGIQEWIGMVGIGKIEGDYYNVVGMPIGMVWEALKGFGMA